MFWGNVHDPETIIPDFGPTKLFKIIQEEIQNRFCKILCWVISEYKTENVGKDVCRQFLEIRFINSGTFLIWD